MTRLLMMILVILGVALAGASTASADSGTVGAGYFHSCGVTPFGGAKCWGEGADGRLGTGNQDDALTAVGVSGLGAGVSKLAVGLAGGFSCAVVNGGAKCWGKDDEGQLGNGAGGPSLVPVDVEGLTSGVTSIGAGEAHACAVQNGAIKCWGRGTQGQLGDGNSTSSATPVTVSGIASGATVVDGSSQHTCAVVGGIGKCWGEGANGRLGNGAQDDSPTPVDVLTITGVTDITAGLAHTCAVAAGAAKCWGSDTQGQAGNGIMSSGNQPHDVTGLSSGVTAISAGYYFTCAVVSGAAKCWGANGNGQLGTGASGADQLEPVDVSVITSGVEAIAGGAYHTCAIVGSEARCWGQGAFGRLGHNSVADSPSPVTVVDFLAAFPQSPGPGPGDGSPNPAAPPSPPAITFAPKRVKAGKRIALKVQCAVGCKLALNLKIGKKAVKGLKPLNVKPGATTATVALPKKAAKQVKSALKRSRKTKVRLTITPSSANVTGTARIVALTR